MNILNIQMCEIHVKEIKPRFHCALGGHIHDSGFTVKAEEFVVVEAGAVTALHEFFRNEVRFKLFIGIFSAEVIWIDLQTSFKETP